MGPLGIVVAGLRKLAGHPVAQLVEQGRLGREVVEEGSPRHVGRFADRLDGHGVEALALEQRHGGVVDLAPRALLLAGAAGRLGGRGGFHGCWILIQE